MGAGRRKIGGMEEERGTSGGKGKLKFWRRESCFFFKRSEERGFENLGGPEERGTISVTGELFKYLC